MRPEVFEALAPLCPRCLHDGGLEAPLVIAERAAMRAGHLWHGILHCSNSACWIEFPVIDGVPVIVSNPAEFIRNSRAQILARAALPDPLESLIGDALGPGSDFDTTRQHLSIYAWAHYSDWAGGEAPDILGTFQAGFEVLPGIEGPAIDLGGSVGRGGWELAARTAPALVADLNFSFLQFAQELALEGEARLPRRRTGLVYKPVTIRLPEGRSGEMLDFWAVDAMALPFAAASFRFASAINLVDSITGPTEAIAEAARILSPGGTAIFATPHDWSPAATEPARWLGGHSQRAPHGGMPEPVLRATLEQHGLTPVAEQSGLPWRLRLHDRAVMQYDLQLVGCRRCS